MLKAFVKHVSKATGLPPERAEAALGIILNAADRQGACLAEEVFQAIPGARSLAARMGAKTGAASGVIARLIERTPGGRQAVAEQIMRDLGKAGLGPQDIGNIFPAIGRYMQSALGVAVVGHLGDVFGAAGDRDTALRRVA